MYQKIPHVNHTSLRNKRKRSVEIEGEGGVIHRRAAPGFYDLLEEEEEEEFVAPETLPQITKEDNSVLQEEATISLLVLGGVAGIATIIILISAILLRRR